jgi:ABC-type oligopeptide transport system substrate-binding subunit
MHLRLSRLQTGGLITGIVSVLTVAACGGGGTGTQSSSGALAANQALTFPIFGDLGTLDPAQLDAETDFEIGQNVFDNLLQFDTKTLKLEPDLATTVPTTSNGGISSDQLTYTFHLRSGVKFSNGDPFTSADVLYSWNRAAALQGAYATNLAAIAGFKTVSANTLAGTALEAKLEAKDPSVTLSGLTAPDPQTVVVKLAQPAGYFLQAIALKASTGAIVDVNAVKQDPDNWWAKPATLVGTGAFKMTARTPNQSMDFAAVPNWWGSPQPTLKTIHIDILQNTSTGIQKYEQGGYDLVGYGGFSNLPVDDVQRIMDTPNEKNQLISVGGVRTYWVSFNVAIDSKRAAKGPFAPVSDSNALALRKAFALAIDKSQLVSIVCKSIVCTQMTGGVIAKGLQGYLGDNQDPLAKFDPSQAKQLLQQADPTGSKTKGLTYVYDPNNPLSAPTAENLQSQWQTNLGIHVDIQPVDHSPFIKARLKGSYVLSRDGWSADYDHPQDWFDNLWGTALGCPDANCTSGYATPEYDSTLAQADQEPLSQALPLYEKLGKLLESDAVYIPLYQTKRNFLIKPYLQGAGSNPFFDYLWDQMKVLAH